MSDRNRGSNPRNDRGNPHKRKRINPRRGGPGVLLTCERGREGKCKREGLDILRYYLSNQSKSDDITKNRKFTLEEEIALLQKGASTEQVLDSAGSKGKTQAFGAYETGCGGTVLVMCTLPGSALIPPICTEWRKEASDSKRKTTEDANGNDAPKRARLEGNIAVEENQDESAKEGGVDKHLESKEASETSTEAETLSKGTPPWDPLDTVHRILNDLDSASKAAPSSRFVTRMIPIQATCFASIEEIGLTAKALVHKYLKDKKPSTFAVTFKRRNCSTVTRDEVINAIAGDVLDMEGAKDAWKVDLKSPKYAIMVEICKTVCGMTIVENCAAYRKFNLVEIREAQQSATTDKT